jgi:hypothetical protein
MQLLNQCKGQLKYAEYSKEKIHWKLLHKKLRKEFTIPLPSDKQAL